MPPSVVHHIHCGRPAVPRLPELHFKIIRHASTSSARPPFPFPSHARPTPHQIFHLPYGASQQDIKARCTSLLFLYTSDSPGLMIMCIFLLMGTTQCALSSPEDFDLVKIYHPDSIHGRDVPDKVRRARFQLITHAYDVLRGKNTLASLTASRDHWWNDPVRAELERRRRRGPSVHSHGRAHDTASTRGWGARNFAYDYPFSTDEEWRGRGKGGPVDGWNEQWKDKVIICAAVLVRNRFSCLYAF